MPAMGRRVLVVGWDGAEPDLVEELLAQGRLPALASLRARGRWGKLASTIPPSSLPAWTSALTGVKPDHHGVVDFLRRSGPGRELVLSGAHERVVPTILARLAASGTRVASLGIPGTHPSEPEVLSIPGSDAPLADHGLALATPAWFRDWLRWRNLSWPAGSWEMWTDTRWHRELSEKLLARLRLKADTVEAVLRAWQPELTWVVFNEFDTAAHHFWALRGASDGPRRRGWPAELPLPPDLCRLVLEELDRILGRLTAACDTEHTTVLVVSDHGFGGNADWVVYPNRFLARQGWLAWRRPPLSARLARLAEMAAERLPANWLEHLAAWLPSGPALALESWRRLGSIDYSRSAAWCDEMPQYPGVWLAVRGRDRPGLVPPGQAYLRVRRCLARQLLDWRDEQGRRIVARVYFREDLGSGPLQSRRPDLLLELSQRRGYRLLAGSSAGPGPEQRLLRDRECLSGKGIGTSGSHRPLGMICAAGPGIATGALAGAHICDLAPTVLTLLGRQLPPGLCGRPLPELCGPAAAGAGTADRSRLGPGSKPGQLLRQLRRLGYLQ